jgi:ABC-type lipoprotein export system ATPase subunit
MSTILAVKDVSYTYVSRYQRVEALKHVTCSFEQGGFHAVTGRSGSGKSTLLSLLAGLDVPTSGDITFEGVSLASLNRDRYRRDTASVIYQSYNLFPLLTALENVMYPMELQGKKRREASPAAAKLLCGAGIDESMHRKFPQMLSGGEQQRVALARALAVGGSILLGNLDSANEKMVVKFIKTLAHERNICAVVVTHNEYVSSEADSVYEMSDGELKT